MDNKKSVTSLTRNNWLMDFSLFMTAVVTGLSGIYFLYLPDGGFKGGRNPLYGIRILFLRETWEWLHTWIGVARNSLRRASPRAARRRQAVR